MTTNLGHSMVGSRSEQLQPRIPDRGHTVLLTRAGWCQTLTEMPLPQKFPSRCRKHALGPSGWRQSLPAHLCSVTSRVMQQHQRSTRSIPLLLFQACGALQPLPGPVGIGRDEISPRAGGSDRRTGAAPPLPESRRLPGALH